MAKRKKSVRWVRLDTAAKIYPAASRKNWSNVFRESMTLSEEVDVPVLREALEVTVRRFPTIAARLRRGAFWYYLQQLDTAPEIREEQSYPLALMSREEMRRAALRVIVYHDRIAVEFFHSLTDGNGAMVFLKTLVAEYLERKYGVTVPAEQGVLARDEKPRDAELEDSFGKYAGPVAASRRESNAWHMNGEPTKDGFLNLTCFRLPAAETLELAHRYSATVTVFLSAVLMQALSRLQSEKEPRRKRQKPVKILIPVNLRKILPSETLRNFVMYSIPEIDPRKGEYSLEEICRVVEHRLGFDVTPKHMASMIATNVNVERNPLVRISPLPVKNAVMRVGFDSVGERKSCLAFSNLGMVKLPEVMRPFVRRMDFILGAQSAAPYNCAALCYGDTIYVNFIRNIRDAELERHFFAILRDLGLCVTVESNREEV